MLNLGQLQEKGYMAIINNGICEIYDSKKGLVACAKMTSNRLFSLQIKALQTCFIAKKNGPTWLWHFIMAIRISMVWIGSQRTW